MNTHAEANDILVNINGKTVLFPDAKPLINENQRVLCPVRFIAEAMGASVLWLGKNHTVSVVKGNREAKFEAGTNIIRINGNELKLSDKTAIISKRTYVPLQFFSEVFDVIVDWNYKTGVLSIESLKTNEEKFFEKVAMSDENKKIAANLNQYLNAYQKAANFQGSVLIAKEGNILINRGYGAADFLQSTKNTSQTRFAIGSVTKQFTAMAIMQLQEKGLLSVEDKLSEYYPDFKRGDEITIHNLLTHSSGIPNYTDMPEYIRQITKIYKAEDIISFLKDKPLDFDPGKEYKYSNSGYLLLGGIIESASKLSFDEYLKNNIFDPLGMKDSGVCYDSGKKGSQVSGHIGYLDIYNVDDEMATKVAHSAGNIYSTVEDLYRWDRALYTEKLVSKTAMEKIFTPHIDTKGMGYYGYGWVISESELGKGVMHSGFTLGFSADFRRYVDRDITIIVLANKDHMNTSKMFAGIKAILAGSKYELPIEKKTIKIDSSIYKKYAGDYEISPGITVKITNRDGHLYAGITGQGSYEIFPESETQFFYRIVDAEITFVTNDKGEVVELVLHQNGQDIHAKSKVYAKEIKKEAVIDRKVFEAYAGEYELAPGINVRIFAEEDHYYAQVTGQGKLEIFAESEMKFFGKAVDVRITFEKNDMGEVTGLVISQSGMTINAKKIK
ncbi:MAG: serine hydrolase [Clostridia bacterium]|nr:serine hydrolase [Clostridia bacterium]